MQKSRQGGDNGRGNNKNCSPTSDTVYSINNNWFFFSVHFNQHLVLNIQGCFVYIALFSADKDQDVGKFRGKLSPMDKGGIRSRGKKIDKGQELRAGEPEQKR